MRLTDWLTDAIYDYDMPEATLEYGTPYPLAFTQRIPLSDCPPSMVLAYDGWDDVVTIELGEDGLEYRLDATDVEGDYLVLHWEAAGDA